VVIGRRGRDIELERAPEHILGYALLDDFSARDAQLGEMAVSTGPYKGKDFAWGLGPWIVTPDELGDPTDLAMRVLVNDEVVLDARRDAVVVPRDHRLHLARRAGQHRRCVRLANVEQRLRLRDRSLGRAGRRRRAAGRPDRRAAPPDRPPRGPAIRWRRSRSRSAAASEA
jgi:Fumarylacetoacetate (FAA) hydrolase family